LYDIEKEERGIRMPKVKRMLLRSGSLLIIVLAVLTWIYPFSFPSFYKSFDYTPDRDFTADYKKDLNRFKKVYEKHADDSTTRQTYAVLSFYEQDWVMQNKAVTINAGKLEQILDTTTRARDKLLRLTVREEYTQEARQDLLDSILNLSSFEEAIKDIQNSEWESRGDLERYFKNLQGSFHNSFHLFSAFYETALKLKIQY